MKYQPQCIWILLVCILTAHFTTETRAGLAVEKRTEKEISEAIVAVSGISTPLIDKAISIFSDPSSSSAWRPMNAHFVVDSSKALGSRPNLRPPASSSGNSPLSTSSLTPNTLLGSPAPSPTSSSFSPSPSSPSSSSSPSQTTSLSSPSSPFRPSSLSNRPNISSHRPPQSGTSLKPQPPLNSNLPTSILSPSSPSSSSSNNAQVNSFPFAQYNPPKPAQAPSSNSPQQTYVSSTNTDSVGGTTWASEGQNSFHHQPGGSQHLSMNLMSNLADLTSSPNVQVQVAADSILNSVNSEAHALIQNLLAEKDKNKPKNEGQHTIISRNHVVQLKNN